MSKQTRDSQDSGSRLRPGGTHWLFESHAGFFPDDSNPSAEDALRRLNQSVPTQSPADGAESLPLDYDEDSGMISRVIAGRYRILSRLGKGGMSTVYKARHLLLQQDVAIKVILPEKLDSQVASMRFLQEAKAAMALSHPRIASMREFGDDEGLPYLVMDYVEGETLAQYLAHAGRPYQEWALTVAIQICQGLEHAHNQGIIHRDLKPANLILVPGNSDEPSIKIIDFGLAKRLDTMAPNLTREGEVFGTPTYMSPQQCLGEEVDSRADIYSLGCILYELLTGHPPFENENFLRVIMAHVNSPVKEIESEHISNSLKAVVMRCLDKNPDGRYQTAQSLRQDLERIRQGHGILSHLIDRSDNASARSTNNAMPASAPPVEHDEGERSSELSPDGKGEDGSLQEAKVWREKLYYHVGGVTGASVMLLLLTETIIVPWLSNKPVQNAWFGIPVATAGTFGLYVAIFGKFGMKLWVSHFLAVLRALVMVAIVVGVFWVCFGQSGMTGMPMKQFLSH